MKVNNFGFVVAVVVVLLCGECNAEVTDWYIEQGTLYVIGSGTMPNYPPGGPWCQDNAMEIVNIVIGSGLTSIGDYAFFYLPRLEKVTIPKTVTSIGVGVFIECKALKTIVLESGNPVFNLDANGVLFNGTTLLLYPCGKDTATSYQLPAGALEIASYAFCSNQYLTTVGIPSSLSKIGVGAFYMSPKIENIKLPQSLQAINSYTFFRCKSLKKINFPSRVTIIGRQAFSDTDLSEVVLPNSVGEVGDRAFENNHHLRSVDLEKVYAMGSDVFDNCERLQRVTSARTADLLTNTNPFRGTTILYAICVPSSYSSSTGTFGRWTPTRNCPALDELPGGGLKWSINEGTLTISGEGGMIQYTENELQAPWYPERESIKRIVIGGQVHDIGRFAFNGCDNFEEIVIPKNLEYIGDDAFRNCKGLKNITVEDGNPVYYSLDGVLFYKFQYTVLVRFPASKIPKNNYYTIPDGVPYLRSHSFYNCQGLKTVNIPDSVWAIPEYAFAGCNNLTKVVSGNLHALSKNSFPSSLSKFTQWYYRSTESPFCDGIYLSDLPSLTVCVPSNYSSRSFCSATITKTGECASFMEKDTPCYEVTFVIDDDGIERVIQTKRKNATEWEDQSTECMSYTCDEDGPNSRSACNSDPQVSRFCVVDKCIDNWNTATMGWFVSFPLNDVRIEELNMSKLIEDISSLSQVSKDDITAGTETNEAGLMVTSFSIHVKDEESAQSIANAVNGITEEGCAYGVLCNHGDAAIYYNENKPQPPSSSSSSSSLTSRSSSPSPSFSSSSLSSFSSSSSSSSGSVFPGSSGSVFPGSSGSDIEAVSGALSAHSMMVKTTMAFMVMLGLLML